MAPLFAFMTAVVVEVMWRSKIALSPHLHVRLLAWPAVATYLTLFILFTSIDLVMMLACGHLVGAAVYWRVRHKVGYDSQRPSHP